MEKLLSVLPKGQGTYITLAVGIVVAWVMVLVPGVGDAIGFHDLTAEQAWQATWEALTAAFFRRAIVPTT